MSPTDLAGLTLLHFIWQGTIIGAATIVLLQMLRRSSAQARYAAACAALVLMLAAPAITALTLARTIAVSPRASSVVSARSTVVAAPSRSYDSHAAAAVGPAVDVNAAQTSSWLTFVVGIWMAGVSVLAARVTASWWSVRRLYRTAFSSAPSRFIAQAERLSLRLGLHRALRVVDSIDVDTPTVIGWLKPVVLLPVAAMANLTPAQVEAILAHELAHVRRLDGLVNLLQIGAETMLFYHPAVWWVSSRIRTEREHCCDEIATSICSDAITYAEALVELERWRTDTAALALTATGGALLVRVRRILGLPSDDATRSSAIVTLAGIIAIILCVAGANYYLRAAQDQPLAPIDPDDAAAWQIVFSHDDSQMRFIGFRGRDLVRFAYQIPSARVVGGPSWMDEEILRLVVALDHSPSADEMPDVVRRVLEDRLHLQTHIEQRNFPVRALVLANANGTLGPNLVASTTDCFDFDEWVASGQPPRQLPPAVPRQPVCGEERHGTPIGHHSYIAITMPQLAEELRHADSWLTAAGRRPRDTVDRTGLTGRYDVDFESLVPAAALMARYPILTNVFEPLGYPPLPRALENQLGLRLVETEAPFDVIIIDSAERPIP
jgi:uncharacterized protein (TIGR03435 family)